MKSIILRPVFPYWYSVWISVHWWKWGTKVPHYYCVIVDFCLYVSVFALHTEVLRCWVSIEKLADNLMGFSLDVICLFSPVAFNNLSLSLIFVSLIIMFFGVFVPSWVYSVLDSLCFPDMVNSKVLEFQLQHQSFQWIFRVDFL